MRRLMRFNHKRGQKPKVVIVKGNPDKMVGMEKLAQAYYQEIANYLEDMGFKVEMDDGEPKTCPDMNAIFWVAHSRGVDRERCVPPTEKWRFLKFGDLEGVIHPTDARWQRSITNHATSKQQPPKEHFVFTIEQQEAINALVRKLSKHPDFKDRFVGR